MEPSTQGIPDVTSSRWLTLLEGRAARAGLIAVTLVAGLGIKLSIATPASADGPLDGLTERVSRTAEERLSPEEKKPERARDERPKSDSERSRADDALDAVVVKVESVRSSAEPAAQAIIEAATPVTSSVAPVLEQAAPVLGPVIETVQPVVDTRPVIGAVEQVLAPVAEVLPPVVEILPPVVTLPETQTPATQSTGIESAAETLLVLPFIETSEAPVSNSDAASSVRIIAPIALSALPVLQAELAIAAESTTIDGVGIAAPAGSFGQADASSTRGAAPQRQESPLPRFERVDPSFASLPLWGMVIALAWLVLGGSRRTTPRTWQSQLFTPPR